MSEDATALTALEAELQRALDMQASGKPLGRSARGWIRLTRALFCDILDAARTAGPRACSDPHLRLLPRLLSDLRQAAAARACHSALASCAAALREGSDIGTGTQCVISQKQQQSGGGVEGSAWEISCGGLSPVCILLQPGHSQPRVQADVRLDSATLDVDGWARAQAAAAAAALDGGAPQPPPQPPRPSVAAPTKWLAFWVADAVCVHTLLALHAAAEAKKRGTSSWGGRRCLVLAAGRDGITVTGEAKRSGAITWSVMRAGKAVDLSAVPGEVALDKLRSIAGL